MSAHPNPDARISAPYVPHDAPAERGLLASILASEGEVFDRLAHAFIPELFWLHPYPAVFAALTHLHQSGSPLTLDTLQARLSATSELAGIGGLPALYDLQLGGMPSVAEQWLARLQEQVALRRVQNLAQWATAQFHPGLSPADFLADFSRRTGEMDPGGDIAETNGLPAVATEMLADLDRMDRGERAAGLQTGIAAWDKLFGGLMDGNFYGLGGRPGTGKSAMMEQMVYKLTCDEVPVLVFEKDMSLKMLLNRMACRAAKVPYWRFVRELTNPQEREMLRVAVRGLNESNLRLHNPRNLTAERLCAIVRREQRQHGVKAVFLDHVQLLDIGRADLREGLTQASIILSRFVPECGIPLVALFHVNRTGAQGRPKAEDVKEFDQLYGDVDGMAMLWSEKKREDLEPDEMLPVNLFAAKNRNGPVTEEEMLFDGQMMKFHTPAVVVKPAPAAPARRYPPLRPLPSKPAPAPTLTAAAHDDDSHGF